MGNGSWLQLMELLVRVGSGGILLAAGIAKLRIGQADVVRSVVGYGVLPLPLAKVSAGLLPLVEIGLGIVLVLGFFTTIVAAAAATLMVLITGAVAQALMRGRSVPCGCFGRGTKLITWRIVARNAIVIAALAGLAVGGSL